ncbi:AfsR/SARP family transcriptional regulator [Streptomyces maremycinicus]|uniref:AfsR/SARP family transcriptional regulator n=1 Tax=Streptomyces maremycinicus TaxID=1679753 RepID=UPI000788F9D4|nr:BTAD domain-containing putative transcriptional regulator [Streptomyces sp. NBRC 110468]
MRFGVLGPLVVWGDEGETITVPETKVRALLADLLAHEGGPVSVDRLIHDLWGDEPPGRPAGALQAKVSQLRRVLGRDRLVRQPPGYRLRLDDDEVDAVRFRVLVAQARPLQDPRARAALLSEALDLWRGIPYADFADEEFVRGAAQRLAEQRLAAAEERAEARLAAGDHSLVAGELAGLVAQHPLRERLRGVQMRALYLAGRQSEALASYEDLRSRLAEELGVDPGPELGALHRAVLSQDPVLAPARTAPGAPGNGHSVPGALLRSPAREPVRPGRHQPTAPPTPAPPPGSPPPSGVHSNLPVQLTPLVGRGQALAELSRLLGTARLVTVTGPGGVGKTRLALAAAEEAAARAVVAGPPDRSGDGLREGLRDGRGEGLHTEPGEGLGGGLRDGVWLLEFAGVRSGTVADLAQVVSTALGIRDAPSAGPGPGAGTGGPSPAHRLATALRDRRTLLVLDNCEHVVDAAAELVESLLRTAPGLRVLATSQEPFGLTGESVFLAEPLPIADAVRLFRQRAAASAPGFPLDPDRSTASDRAAVAEICRRLDGIPLALELAATRVRGLGVRELAARLGCRFQLLTAGRRGAPARQQTLRAVIDWSWELLSAPERVVLGRLAAHSDGCDLAAAEAVCAGDGVAREDVLDLVTRLVGRSLVVMLDGPDGPRYRLLESVAAYASERLHEREDVTVVRDRHLRHYLALAEEAEPRLRDAGQRPWLARLDAEAGNLRAALDEAVRRAGGGEADQAVRLATALSWWWLPRGRLAEARRDLAAVLTATAGTAADGAADGVGTPSSAPTTELALLHPAFALLTGDHAATADVVDARAAADAIADPVRRGRALWLCAYGLFSAGAADHGSELNTQALELFRAAGDQWGTAASLGLRATIALVRGDLEGLGRDGRRSAALFHELGDRWGELQTVSPLAALAEIRGEYAEAARRQHEGLRMAEELGLAAEVAARLSGLGRLALLARNWDRARELHERARRSAADQGYKYGEIHAEMGLALGARRSGDLDAAEAHLLVIRDGYAEVSSLAGDHLLRAELGFLAELRGEADRALAHHLRGLDFARSLGEPRAMALSLEGLAGVAALRAHEGAAGCSALLLGAADAARRGVGAPLPPAERGDVERVTAAARAALGESAFADAFGRGTRLTAEEAVLHARTALGRPEDLPA